jgi:hypothetical protein
MCLCMCVYAKRRIYMYGVFPLSILAVYSGMVIAYILLLLSVCDTVHCGGGGNTATNKLIIISVTFLYKAVDFLI